MLTITDLFDQLLADDAILTSVETWTLMRSHAR